MNAKLEKPVHFSGNSRIHLGLRVRQLQASVDFYSHVFGQGPTKLRADYAKFEVPDPSVNFTLNQASGEPAEGGALTHLGIQLKRLEQLERVQERLAGLGLIKTVEKETSCCYAKQDKIWLKDPDGNGLEFFVVLEDEASREVKAEACCG